MNEMSRLVTDQDDFRARFTVAEFDAMDELGAFDDMRVELVDGELERMQYPLSRHAARQAQIVFKLASVVGIDRVLGETGIRPGGDTAMTCDVALLKHPIAENRRVTPADLVLVIEIAETTRHRDLGVKRRKYADAGIPHYWVVDGEQAVTHAFSLIKEAYPDAPPIPFGQPLPVPGTDATIVID